MPALSRILQACLLSLLLALGPLAFGVSAFIGDLDDDNTVTVADLVRLLNHLNNVQVLSAGQLVPADVNGDGKVDEQDVIALRETILGTRAIKLLPDADADGLPDVVEALLGLDPKKADSDGNGVKDGDEDPDHDGLSNRAELFAHTDPSKADTDGDGWLDEAEVTAGSDPRDPTSRPSMLYVAAPPVRVQTIGTPNGVGALGGIYFASPPTRVLLPGLDGTLAQLGVFVAKPPVTVVLPAGSDRDPLLAGMFVAQPMVKVALPGFTPDSALSGFFVGQPPVKARISGP